MVLLGKLLLAGPLVYVEGKKPESGQYLAAKFSQRRGGWVKNYNRHESEVKCKILVIGTSSLFFSSNTKEFRQQKTHLFR